MKRYAPWLLLAFVLALLTQGLCVDRPARMLLDSPIAQASYLDVSRHLVPALAVMVPAVEPGKFGLHLEARRSRVGHDESLPLSPNFSFDHALLRAHDTGPPGIDLCGPPVWLRPAPRSKSQGPPDPPADCKGGKLSSEPVKHEAAPKIGVPQRVIFTTGFS